MAKVDIKGSIGLDSSKFERGIQRSKNAIGRMQKAVVNASNALAKMGLAAASAAVLVLSRNAIKLGSELSDIAISTGFATEQFQVFRGALIDAGGKAESMEKAVTIMQKAIVQGSEGLTTYVRAFERLGLNVNELRQMKPEQQFQVIGKAIASAKDQQGALTAAIEIFGQRNAPRLIEVFKRLDSEGYGKMAKDIEAAYGIMTAETQKALDRAADAIERFKNKATIKVGELIAGEANGSALKELGFRLMAVAARFGGKIIDALVESAQMGRATFGATADWLASKLGSSFRMIGIQFKLAMIDAANVAIRAANKISKLTLFEEIGTGDVYGDLRDAIKDSGREWNDFFADRLKDFKDMNLSEDLGKEWDKLADTQRAILEDSRKTADEIADAGSKLSTSVAKSKKTSNESAATSVAGSGASSLLGAYDKDRVTSSDLKEKLSQTRSKVSELRSQGRFAEAGKLKATEFKQRIGIRDLRSMERSGAVGEDSKKLAAIQKSLETIEKELTAT